MLDVGKSILDIIEKGGRSGQGQVVEIPMNQISPSRYQPRIRFDEHALDELAESIATNGLIQPITVRKMEDHYEIIAGERRYRACKKLKQKTITCYVLSPSEAQAAEMALVENIQRENLTAIEEAKSYIMIMRQAGLTQDQVAKRVGKSQSSVANKIRLLNLPDEVQQAVVDQAITERHARALLQVPEDRQVQAYHYILDRSLNVRQTEAYIEKLNGPEQSHKRQKTVGFTRNTQIGINSINECVNMIKNMGIDVVMETEETLTDVKVIVRFPK